jgi:hypothetical protein
LGQLEQLITLETAQYRQRAVMSHQSIVQNDLAERRVKKIRHRMTMQIDHEYPPLRNALISRRTGPPARREGDA